MTLRRWSLKRWVGVVVAVLGVLVLTIVALSSSEETPRETPRVNPIYGCPDGMHRGTGTAAATCYPVPTPS